MDAATAPTSVFASSAAGAEHVDALVGRLLARLAAAATAVGTFARRRRKPARHGGVSLTHESVALDLENRRIAAELRAQSQGGAAAARIL
ncbi:hypothetical protein MUN74_09075 [Agromyces endophyticus]|uniref:hypothetical protein n=1 Tax=Agromyces sp. H17E-10 TaxID=2932244 RepID=UPI001FD134F3|nr:hypothetical protein [Agromyces sp. H17E-10]UOQ91023.1 hypothetical protein MUN74_09075 [Agromyces sp. H17E-10]